MNAVIHNTGYRLRHLRYRGERSRVHASSFITIASCRSLISLFTKSNARSLQRTGLPLCLFLLLHVCEKAKAVTLRAVILVILCNGIARDRNRTSEKSRIVIYDARLLA